MTGKCVIFPAAPGPDGPPVANLGVAGPAWFTITARGSFHQAIHWQQAESAIRQTAGDTIPIIAIQALA
jgi:hypothetical protein